jgi:hypothetical protein
VDQLVRNTRPVELGGINVVHALCHRVAEDVQRLLTVEWWPEHAGTGQLYGAEGPCGGPRGRPTSRCRRSYGDRHAHGFGDYADVRKVTSHAAGSPEVWTSVLGVVSVPMDEDVGDPEGAGGRAAMRATANATNAMQAPTTKAVV